jgi:hypothetical protein
MPTEPGAARPSVRLTTRASSLLRKSDWTPACDRAMDVVVGPAKANRGPFGMMTKRRRRAVLFGEAFTQRKSVDAARGAAQALRTRLVAALLGHQILFHIARRPSGGSDAPCPPSSNIV